MGFQETFNERVIPAAERAFGFDATLLHGDSLVELSMSIDRMPPPAELDGTRTRVFKTEASYLVSGSERFVPVGGDVVTYTNANSQPEEWYVFPLVRERCFDYDTHTESRIKIYTVYGADLLTAKYRREGSSVVVCEFKGVRGPRRFLDQFNVDTGERVRPEHFTVLGIDKRILAAAGITNFERGASVEIDGERWELDEQDTVWGAGAVTLGLIREPLVRLNERRNAAV